MFLVWMMLAPIRRALSEKDWEWRARREAGEKVFPASPTAVAFLCIVGSLSLFVVINALTH
jgi:hypothetical protein